MQVLDRARLVADNRGFEAACAAIRIVSSIAKSAQENRIQIKPEPSQSDSMRLQVGESRVNGIRAIASMHALSTLFFERRRLCFVRNKTRSPQFISV